MVSYEECARNLAHSTGLMLVFDRQSTEVLFRASFLGVFVSQIESLATVYGASPDGFWELVISGRDNFHSRALEALSFVVSYRVANEMGTAIAKSVKANDYVNRCFKFLEESELKEGAVDSIVNKLRETLEKIGGDFSESGN